MLQHTLLIAYRNFKRYKSSFFINLIGLSTGLACSLLIYLWVNDELNVDRFFEKDGQLYQIIKTYPNADGTISTGEETPALLADMLAEEIPEVKYSVSTIGRNMGILSAGEKRMKAKPQFVDKDFFNVFSYQLVQGDKNKVLSEKYGVILSDKLALKLFKTTENILGKTVVWDGESAELNGAYTIAGIFESPPANASLQFDILFTYALYFDTYKERYGMTYWGSNTSHTFVILKEETNLQQINDKIKDYSKVKYKALHGMEGLEWEGRIFLQRYSEKYLHNRFENGVQAGGRVIYVRLFSIIALCLLAIACINFMNLSTAQAARRMKEIGIKRAIGAGQKTLLFQYLCESVCMAMVALAIAVVLITFLLPSFNGITGKQLTLNFDTELILTMLGITIVTGIISGSYPAFYLSSFRPAMVLKGKMNSSVRESRVRKGLVVFQFAISIILIVSVLVVYKQIQFIQSKNLGYSKDNIISFTNEGQLRNHLGAFLEEVKQIPGVVNTSTMGGDLVGHHGGGGGIDWEGKHPDQGIEFSALYAGYNLIETLGLKMAEGRAFSEELGSDSSKVIFNETAIKAMSLNDPVGKTVKMWGKEKQIVGIVKDFHFESLYESVKPFFFRMPEDKEDNQNVLVKIKFGMEIETIERIQEFYQSFNEGLPFEYKFLDADYQKLYASEQRVAVLSRYFAGIAILVSCLGLFGLATFTAERRLKEIGIRKVLGSTAVGIVYLLSVDFTKIVLASIVIALPFSYLITAHWLDRFAFRIELELWYFLGAGLLALIIAWLTVGSQAIKAANVNPANSLRSE